MKKPKLPEETKPPLSPIPLRAQVSPAVIDRATLRSIRDEATRQHSHTRMMIAELDELSEEINATLAFLKARRGDK